mgnify:CR=1 FL=1
MLKSYLLFELLEDFHDMHFRNEKDLVQVMKDIFSRTERPFVILIDEWDCLFREYQKDQEAQKQYLDFLRVWLKDKEYVALAYMTGILPVKKLWNSFCFEYVYRVFHDRSGKSGRIFWVYRR